MEDDGRRKTFWAGKRVLVTGHTGFKGAWLCHWLHLLGAKVTGYALEPPTQPSLFGICGVDRLIESVIADTRDQEALRETVERVRPQVIFHLAAQAEVRTGYEHPVETYSTNIMGTVNLLDAVRSGSGRRGVLIITSDKCYDCSEASKSFSEEDRLGGRDPYSSSKACTEMVISAFQQSYFHPDEYGRHQVGLATARAGNVIGGGDWAASRLVPDCIRAILQGKQIVIRKPGAIRPWQHVLDPLSGYLLLAERLYTHGPVYADGWNFGPSEADAVTVERLIQILCDKWGHAAGYFVREESSFSEEPILRLDCSKAREELGWGSRWNLEVALEKTLEWVRAFQRGDDMGAVCFAQIERFSKYE